jgi:hypothetical protein
MCQAAWTIQGDGRILTQGDDPAEVGRADGAAMTALAAAVRTADYQAIRSRPFTGTCPVAFDGQEVVLEFHAPEGVQRIASCETDIDWTHPLLAATLAALGDAVPIPTDF